MPGNPPLLPPASSVIEMDACIEIPADQQDAMPRLEHRVLHVAKVIVAINNDRSLRRAGIAPYPRLDRVVGRFIKGLLPG